MCHHFKELLLLHDLTVSCILFSVYLDYQLLYFFLLLPHLL